MYICVPIKFNMHFSNTPCIHSIFGLQNLIEYILYSCYIPIISLRAITGRIYNKEFKTFFFYCSSIFWQMLLSVCAATQNCILKKNIYIQEDHHKVTIADIASWYLIPFAFTTRQNSTKVNIKIPIPIEASWLT